MEGLGTPSPSALIFSLWVPGYLSSADLQNKLTLAEQQFQYDMQLAQVGVNRDLKREQMIEDRKDQRSKMEATQQSSMIQQRQDNLLPTDFSDQPQGEPLAEQLQSQVPQPPQDQMYQQA